MSFLDVVIDTFLCFPNGNKNQYGVRAAGSRDKPNNKWSRNYAALRFIGGFLNVFRNPTKPVEYKNTTTAIILIHRHY